MNLQQLDTALSKMQNHYTKALGQKELLEDLLSLSEDNLRSTEADLMQGELGASPLFTKNQRICQGQLKTRVEGLR